MKSVANLNNTGSAEHFIFLMKASYETEEFCFLGYNAM
jgi:hypothetical protein